MQKFTLQGLTRWIPEDIYFGKGLLYALLRPEEKKEGGMTLITHVRLARSGETVLLGLKGLYLENITDWTWARPDDEELCKLENSELGDCKWIGKLF